jgi:hypothetical protein
MGCGLARCRGRGPCSGRAADRAGDCGRLLAYFGGNALADQVSHCGFYAGAGIAAGAVLSPPGRG